MKDENVCLLDEYLAHEKFQPKLELAQCSKGTHFPLEKCTHNRITFLLEGEILVNSAEYPGTTLTAGNGILQAIGSKVEMLVLKDSKTFTFRFIDMPPICADRFRDLLRMADTSAESIPLPITARLGKFIAEYEEVSRILPEQDALTFEDMKVKELVVLLLHFYPEWRISNFFCPVSLYSESFHHFVMKNFERARSVEEFAHMGGYTVATFRRLFRNIYDMPVYEWVLQRKRERILHDLHFTSDRITTICQRYGFDSLSHFAHFCKDSFGDTPRSLRKRLVAGEKLTVIHRPRSEQKAD